jgi:biotin-(acetyl-CoA carboxylase) ligase
MNKIESAVSLSMVTRKKVSITDLAAHLLSNFHDSYLQWQSQWLTVGNEEVRRRYLKSCETLGINVNFKRGSELLRGYARDVDPQGQLLVELPKGEIMELNSDTAIEVRGA